MSLYPRLKHYRPRERRHPPPMDTPVGQEWREQGVARW